MTFVDFNLLNASDRKDLLELLEKNRFENVTVLGVFPKNSFNYPVDFPRVIALVGGEQIIIRFLDVLCLAHQDRMSSLEYYLSRWKHVFPDASLNYDLKASNPWISRRFFPETLEELLQSSIKDGSDSGFLETVDPTLPLKILQAYQIAAKQGLIHGHISPSNIALINDQVLLLDPCILITFPWRESKHLAPEKTLSPQADYYSIASTLALFKNLPPACSAFVVQALNPDPSKRPSPELIMGGVALAPERVKRKSPDMLFKLLGLVSVLLAVLLGYRAYSKGAPDVSEPEFTQAEITKAIEAKNPDFFRSVVEYVIVSGDVNYFKILTSMILKHPNQSLLNARVKRVLERLLDASLEPDDVRALAVVAFFEFVPPSLARSVNFDRVSLDVMLALRAISDSAQLANVDFSSTNGSDKLKEVLGAISSFVKTDPNSPAFAILAQIWFGVCEKAALERLFKSVSLKEAFPTLRALWERGFLITDCIQPTFDAVGSAYPALGKWFKDNSLVDWERVNSSGKLQLCLGIMPKDLPVEYYQDLVTFPLQDIASQAFDMLENRCPDSVCRRSFPVIFRHKQGLTREQLYSLVNLLYSDKKDLKRYAPIWFSLKPPSSAVLDLVLARDSLSDEDPLTFFAISYLLVHDFKANLGDLIKLTTHKDPKIRRLGILKADPAKEEEKKLLQRLASVEDDRENRKLLREKLALTGKI